VEGACVEVHGRVWERGWLAARITDEALV
jgi:hypothetical protein